MEEEGDVDQNCAVTSMDMVQVTLNKTSPARHTLWVGTASGKIAVYHIHSVGQNNERGPKAELQPTGMMSL